jgi:hypothetical protein
LPPALEPPVAVEPPVALDPPVPVVGVVLLEQPKAAIVRVRNGTVSFFIIVSP